MPSGLECFFEEKCNELACDVLILLANSALRLICRLRPLELALA